MLKIPQNAASAVISKECITLLCFNSTRTLATVSSAFSKNSQFSNQYSKLPPHFLTKSLGRQRLTTLIKGEQQSGIAGGVQRPQWSQTTDECPDRVDVAIFGGGIVGASVAYFLKEHAPTGLTVALFERDLTYLSSATTLSLGGIRQQWQHPENILMSLFTANFLQNVKKNLTVPGAGPELADVGFREQGYLLLADESQAEQMIANHKLQLELGAAVELLSVDRLKERFPHINTEGVLLASHGLRNEGWFDPLSLLQALRRKTVYLGGHYVNGEVVDFRLRSSERDGERIDRCNDLQVRLADGRQKTVRFGIGVICAGVDSIGIAKKLGYGTRRQKKSKDENEAEVEESEKNDVRANEFPVEARKRFAFVAELPKSVNGPGAADFPFMLDTTGAYCRPEGLTGGRYILGKTPTFDEEPDASNLEVDYTYFEKTVLPTLSRRIPAFRAARLRRAWAGYYDVNRVDSNPIIGHDPYYENLIWAAGFTGRGLQMGPAVGRAITELILHDEYRTIDLSQYSWDRFFDDNRSLAQDIII